MFLKKNKKSSDYLSSRASKSRCAIIYPKPALIPIDDPNITYVIADMTEYIPEFLRTSFNIIEKTMITSIINARITKDNIAIPISFFFTINHLLINRVNHILNFWRLIAIETCLRKPR
jgi:hypothetical protein